MDVVKRDGSKEPFDQSKIAKVVKAAGLSDQQADELAGQVASQLNGNQQITSLQIRDLVSPKLKAIDEYAAGLFDWYQKTKLEKNN